MPQARIIDLGWAMARIELDEDKAPSLTICWPEMESETAIKPAGSVVIWSEPGLQALADTLIVWLEDFRIEKQADAEDDRNLG